MNSCPLAELVANLASLAATSGGPGFYVLDPRGEVVTGSTGPEHPGSTLDWRVDGEGRLTAPTPPGWELITLPFDLYGKPDGFLSALVPAVEQEQWRKLLESIHAIERERRTRNFEVDDLAGEVAKNYEHINLLMGLPKDIHLGLEEEDFYDEGLKLAAQVTRAAFALLVLVNPRGDYRVVSVWADGAILSRAATDRGQGRNYLGYEGRGGVTGLALEKQRWVMVERVEREPVAPAPFEEGASSLLVVPLITHMKDSTEEVKGAIVLIDRAQRQREPGEGGGGNFNSVDTKVTELIASQLASMMGNRSLSDIRKEVTIAADLQRSLLPADNPDLAGFDLAGRCQPARFAGGDYYGYLRLAGGGLGCLILDVSGHNLASSLMLPMARAAFSWMGRRERDPGQVVAQVSTMLHGNLATAELFITLFLAALEPGSGQIRVANAGHNPPLLLRAGGGEAEWLDVDGPIIGLTSKSSHPSLAVTLAPGDVLVLYTDGVTETAGEGGEMFGEERLEATVRAAIGLPAQGILERIFAQVQTFGDLSQDDVTLLVIKKT